MPLKTIWQRKRNSLSRFRFSETGKTPEHHASRFMPSRCSEGPDSQSQRFAAVGGSFVRERFKSAFLPKGYPNTGNNAHCRSSNGPLVCKEYLSFSSWQFIHSATGTVTGTLGLQALLQAVGLSQVRGRLSLISGC